MSTITAWLIECVNPTTGNTDSYFAADGDWCNNPNHAHKFATVAEAEAKRVTLRGSNYRVCEHGWG